MLSTYCFASSVGTYPIGPTLVTVQKGDSVTFSGKPLEITGKNITCIISSDVKFYEATISFIGQSNMQIPPTKFPNGYISVFEPPSIGDFSVYNVKPLSMTVPVTFTLENQSYSNVPVKVRCEYLPE